MSTGDEVLQGVIGLIFSMLVLLLDLKERQKCVAQSRRDEYAWSSRWLAKCNFLFRISVVPWESPRDFKDQRLRVKSGRVNHRL